MATANLTWVTAAGALSYKVEYKKSSSGTWIVSAATQAGNTATIAGLDEGDNYDFRVTSNCSAGTSSPITTTQPTPCLNVSGLAAEFVGTTANLSWTKKANAVSYAIQYKLQADSSWTTASGSPYSNSGAPDPVTFSIAGLTNGAAYDFKVVVNCQSGASSTGTTTSVTSTCIAPTDLEVTFS